jgi:hypothetical protein
MNITSLTNVFKMSPIRSGTPQYHLVEVFLIFFIKIRSPIAGRNRENKYSKKRLIRGKSHVIKLQIKRIHIAKKVSDIRNKDSLA